MKGLLHILFFVSLTAPAVAQIGKTFPSEKKIVKDPVTGAKLIFLTSTPGGDSKTYPTHNQWTADGKWVVFRSHHLKNEVMAVNEKTGLMMQVSEGGYTGMLNVARTSMKLYFMRSLKKDPKEKAGPLQVIEVNLEKLFADQKAGRLKSADAYQRVCGTIPVEYDASPDMALDAQEDWAYFRVGKRKAEEHLAPGTVLEKNFGPRNMGAGPTGLAAINLISGELKYVTSVPFQIGHVQTNPWVSGEIVFCWETGGKSPQRTWTVMADGTGLRPLYPEAETEWVTHEAVITKDEVAIAIMGHRQIPGAPKKVAEGTGVGGANPGQDPAWGPSGTREKPTGLAIVNLRTREVMIAGQTNVGSGLWHVSGSPDGRWATGDDFERNIYLINRHSREMRLVSGGHKVTAADHPHPTMSPDGTRILIQSALLSADNRSMNLCIVPVPKSWLKED